VLFGTRCASFAVPHTKPALTLILQERFLMDKEIVEHVIVSQDDDGPNFYC
jgi:hypothetical protein